MPSARLPILAVAASLLAIALVPAPAVADVVTSLTVHAAPEAPATTSITECAFYLKAIGLVASEGAFSIRSGSTEIASVRFHGERSIDGTLDALVGPIMLAGDHVGLVAVTDYDDGTTWNLETSAFDVRGCASECEGGDTQIVSTFNGGAIRAGHTVWFSAVFKPSDPKTPAEYRFHEGFITFEAAGVLHALPVPASVVTLSPTADKATTTFDDATGTWHTRVPLGFGKPIFLTGLAYTPSTDLPGGIKPVAWSGHLSADSPGLAVSWKWAAAVYTTFASDPNDIGVKPIDGGKLSDYANSDHAGTPENYKKNVVGGARGGGGSNYTGSLSATKSVEACFRT